MWAVLSQQNKPGQEFSKPELSSPDKALAWEADPRTQQMGWRFVLQSDVDPLKVIASCQKGDTEDYHRHRYAIGMTPALNKDKQEHPEREREQLILKGEGFTKTLNIFLGGDVFITVGGQVAFNTICSIIFSQIRTKIRFTRMGSTVAW